MTLRYTESKLNQASGHIQLDAQGRLPALSLANVTNVGVEPTSGLNFKFAVQTTTTFTAVQGLWYWLTRADTQGTLEGFGGNSTYTITLPSTGVATGSKVAFSTITRPQFATSVNYMQSGFSAGSGTFQGKAWTIVVPSSAGTGFNSIKAVIKGVTYTEGQSWVNTGGYIREMIFYAHIDSSNNLTWFWFRGGLNRLDDFYNFNTSANAYATDTHYYLKGDGVDTPYKNVREWQSLQITANTTLAFGTNLDAKATYNLITVNAATAPTVTLPAASASLGHLLIFKVLPNFKNTTLSSTAGRTKVSGLTLQRAGTDNLIWSGTATTQTAFTSITIPNSTYDNATNSYSSSVWLAFAVNSINWAVVQLRTKNAY